VPFHPFSQRHLVDTDVARDFRDRPVIVDDESYRLLLVVIRETPTR